MITLCMLVKDPPLDRLVALLEYVKPLIGQTVAVVDDRTDPRAFLAMSGWGIELVPFTWVDDFSAARNAALPYAKGDWILHLDPDELPSADMMTFLSMVDRSPWSDVEWQGSIYPAPRGYLFFTRNFFDA